MIKRLRIGVLIGFLSALLGMISYAVWMPGSSYTGAFKPLNDEEQLLSKKLFSHVQVLAVDIGNRSSFVYENLKAAEHYIEKTWNGAGLEVQRQEFLAPYKGKEKRAVANISVEFAGHDESEVLVIGGHYDTVMLEGPGANDNGTGAAAVIELALRYPREKQKRSVRFVAFVNEEPPFFQTSKMGSLVYAKSIKNEGLKVVNMISLETIGYYSEEKNSQHYPFPFSLFYPSKGNFIAFVGNTGSAAFVRESITSFRRQVEFPSEAIAAPNFIPGIGWSDQWAFWQVGYPALMVTDTALFRYPHYHRISDTIDKLDFDRYTRVVSGLEKVILSWVNK